MWYRSFLNLGTGDSSTPNWYYQSDDSKCTAFLFTGSEGNANRFETQEQCERQCGEFKNQVGQLFKYQKILIELTFKRQNVKYFDPSKIWNMHVMILRLLGEIFTSAKMRMINGLRNKGCN